MPPRAPNTNAYWTTADETVLLEHLKLNAAAAGDGASFKAPTFLSASVAVNAIRTKGGPKTASACKNKFSAVRVKYVLYRFIAHLIHLFIAPSCIPCDTGYLPPVRLGLG